MICEQAIKLKQKDLNQPNKKKNNKTKSVTEMP